LPAVISYSEKRGKKNREGISHELIFKEEIQCLKGK
jgi:hypothetical protein